MKFLAKQLATFVLVSGVAAACGAVSEERSIRSPEGSAADATKSADGGKSDPASEPEPQPQPKPKPKKKAEPPPPVEQPQIQQPAPLPAELPDTKLGWDGKAFKGTPELMLFPIE